MASQKVSTLERVVSQEVEYLRDKGSVGGWGGWEGEGLHSAFYVACNHL